MKTNKINIKANNFSYSIYFGNNLIESFDKIVKKEKIFFNKYLIIIDHHINKKNLSILKTSNKKQKNIYSISFQVKKIKIIKQ